MPSDALIAFLSHSEQVQISQSSLDQYQASWSDLRRARQQPGKLLSLAEVAERKEMIRQVYRSHGTKSDEQVEALIRKYEHNLEALWEKVQDKYVRGEAATSAFRVGGEGGSPDDTRVGGEADIQLLLPTTIYLLLPCTR